MAGGSITRICGGNFTTELSGGMECFTDTFDITGGKQNRLGGKEGTVKDKPGKPKSDSKHVIRGWWSSDKEGEKTINEALIGDIVYFHLETKDIPDGDGVFMSLYDDDVKRANEEKDSNKGSDRIVLNKKQDDFEKVKANKIVKAIDLKNFSSWIEEEEDKTIELYFVCSYKGENVELPVQFHDYLKVKGMPKIIIVNGQWRLAKYTLGENVGPTKPKKPYWVNGFSEAARTYFDKYFSIKKKQKINNISLSIEELEKQNFILYCDGSSYAGGDQSGGDRFKNGNKFAQDNFDEITKGLGGQDVFFVSHSEGGAYAAGMADYLFSKGIKIGEHVLLSPDEGDEFSINPEIKSYQLQYMFFSDSISSKKWVQGLRGLKFKKWDSYYAVVDWVTNEHTIKGVTKSGISHEQNAGWTGVHGWTNGKSVFDRISDLKEVRSFDVIGEVEGKLYSGKDQTKTSKGSRFYKIDSNYIITNCPPVIKIN
jgi:hypothetical protein